MLVLGLLAILGAEPPAPVTGAVVYGGQARLTRTSEVAVGGRERVELPLLPREVEPDSVRVEVVGAELESVEVARLGPLSLRVDEARGVVAALERLDDDLALASAEDGALDGAANLGDQAPEAPDDDGGVWAQLEPVRWRQTLGFLHAWQERIDRRRGAVTARLELLRRRRSDLAERAAALAAGDEGRVRVVVHVSGHGRARLRTSYLVTGPTWTPRYEVRLDSTRDDVQVSLAAMAEQQTGEDWSRAALTFSTALPFVSTAAPELPRWTIGERDRFIPEPAVRPEPDGATPPAPRPPAPSPELTALRARLEALSRPASSARARPEEPAGKTGAALVRELLDSRARQIDGFETAAGGTGSIVGYVFDQSGNPIKGVKLDASGPARKLTYSNDEGWFRLTPLPAGTYEVRATAPKLKTQVQREIRVGNQAAEVALVMEVEGMAIEEVKVVESAPPVNTTSASVEESHESQFVSSFSPGRARPRGVIRLAPPEESSRLSPGLSALAGGHDLSFDALAPETLPSGGLAQRVPLATWRWPVAVRRQLFPAVRPDAYLVANLRSPAAGVLPAGEVALFLDGQPVGRANMTLIRPGQAFTLPLGIDRAVRARRQVALEAHQEGLISKDDVNRYTVTIDVANPHRLGVALDVFDQLPEAGDDSVQVKLESSDPPVKVDDKGLLTWHTGLAAGATAKLRFVYTLRRPKGHRLHQ